MIGLAALLAGLLFGFGLALSGMTDTNKVLGFLDVAGAWQPTLAFVMGSAVLVTLVPVPPSSASVGGSTATARVRRWPR